MEQVRTEDRRTVSERALVQRINRRLAHEDGTWWQGRLVGLTKLCKTRPGRWRYEWGEYIVFDYRRNLLLDTHVDPEAYGRDCGALLADEVVVGEGEPGVAS